MLTGLKDVDREVLKHVDDKELLKICRINKKMWNDVCDDNFLKRRLAKYPEIEKYRKNNESMKRFFSRFIHYTNRMRKYGYNYLSGDFASQYNLLKRYKRENLLFEAARYGELEIVKYTRRTGIFPHALGERAFKIAIENGHLAIVKWLVEEGTSVNIFQGAPLRLAAEYGHFEIFKFLESVGAHTNYEKALMFAHAFGHVELEEYLKSKII